MRPSEILRLETDWTSWQVDEASALIGLKAEAAMMKGEKPDLGEGKKAKPKKFASAKSRVMKTMKIPSSGVW